MSIKDRDNRSFAQFFVERVCPDNRFLDEMDEVIPWEKIDKFLNHRIKYKTGGRPPYPTLLVFKMHLLQTWYNLSDEACEFNVKDRLSFRKFLKLDIGATVPDATTLENFRHRLEEDNLGDKIVKFMDDYFVSEGLILKEGNVVDATFLRANSRPTKTEEKKTDIDAEFGHKGYGYSASTNVDKKSKLIRKSNTTPANKLDYQVVDGILIGDEKEIYGDKGYAPARKWLKKQCKQCKVRVMFKRQRGKKNEPTPELPKRQTILNKAYSKIRAVVEHPYATWKTMFGAVQARYRGLERVNQQVQSLTFAYNFKRMAYLIKRNPHKLQPICA
jgi:transposase, IS5 family